MADWLRKCIAMGPINTPTGDTEDVRFNNNLNRLHDLGTYWVRIWIRWDLAQIYQPGPYVYQAQVPWELLGHPDDNYNYHPALGVNYGWRYIQAIDDQIAQLRAHGFGVILTSWRFPLYSNGCANQNHWTYRLEDRLQANNELKPLEMGIPTNEQLGINGYFGQWINFLINRYKGHGRGLTLEIMNEPNLQMWPQQDAGGGLSIGCATALMMNTAAAVSGAHGHPTWLAAPAPADHSTNNRMRTSWDVFVDSTLNQLDSINFKAPDNYFWTHHNYKDIESALLGSWTPIARKVRDKLVNRWTGYGGKSDPQVFMTEGGARLASVGLAQQHQQMNLCWNHYKLHPGLGMYANYFMQQTPGLAPGNDCALINTDGSARAAYTQFKSWPGYI